MFLKLCAQNLDIFPGDGKHQFARTGEIGCYHLKRAGATGLILGHSETGDIARIINLKWKAAVSNKMMDNIVLVGYDWDELPNGWEKSSEEEKARVKEGIKEKLIVAMDGIGDDAVERAVFGYEPGWGTRGSGKIDAVPPQPDHIGVMCSHIKDVVKEIKRTDARVIYGGSMTGQRARDIMPLAAVDGLILGSAGAGLESLEKITRMMHQSSRKPKQGGKFILALNWKAYELKEDYTQFLDFLTKLDKQMFDIRLAPAATDIREIRQLLDNF